MLSLARSGPRALWVFLFAFLAYAYFMPRWADWNIDSRLDLVHAIVDRHTLSIDAYHYNTWDKAVYHGHYYSDKAPGTAILGVPVYALFKALHAAPVTGPAISAFEQNPAWNVAITLGQSSTQKAPAPKGTNLGGCQRTGVAGNVQYIPWGNRLVPPMRDWALSKYVVTAGAVALPSALFLAFFYWFLGFFAIRAIIRWLLTLLYGLATVALPYATNFYSHQLVAGFLFMAFALLFLRSRGWGGAWVAPAAGFLLGFSLFTEYTVAIVILFAGLYGLWVLRRSWSGMAWLTVSGAIPVAALMAYNQAIFHNPLDTGYSHDFCWSAAQAGGIAGFTYPHFGPLFDLTFGQYRGLFFMSPFLLLALAGAGVMLSRRLGLEAAISLVMSIVFILAISAYWGWNGGRVDGPRYLVPVVPFLAFPAAFYLDGIRLVSWRAVLSVALILWSITITWIEFLGGALFPISWLRHPITQYSLPALQSNQIAPNAGYFFGLRGWESLLPLAVLLLLVGVATWWRRSARAAQRPLALVTPLSRYP